MEPEELAGALQRLADWAERYAPEPEPPVRRRLREHFGADPGELPVVTRSLEVWDRPNLQVALDAWLVDREVEVVGLAVMEGYRAGLAELVRGGIGRRRSSSAAWSMSPSRWARKRASAACSRGSGSFAAARSGSS